MRVDAVGEQVLVQARASNSSSLHEQPPSSLCASHLPASVNSFTPTFMQPSGQ